MALKTFVTGEILTASDTNTYLKNTIYAQKTADESVTSSTTLQDDNHLTVSVAASSTYEVTALLLCDAHPSGDLKTSWVVPASATFDGVGIGLTDTAAAAEETKAELVEETTTDAWGTLAAGTVVPILIRGLLVVAGTAGTFKLQWAQNTSNGTATTLKSGSYVCLRRVS